MAWRVAGSRSEESSYRFLWILGLLAGGGSVMLPSGGAGQSGQTSATSSDLPWLASATSALETGLPAWVAANLGLLIGLGLVVCGLVPALIVASFVARGSIVQATADIATGRPSSLSSAWSAGLRLFWRYISLWMLLIVAAFVVAVTFGIVAAVAAVASFAANSPAPAILVAALVAAAAVAGFVACVLHLRNAPARRSSRGLLCAPRSAVSQVPACRPEPTHSGTTANRAVHHHARPVVVQCQPGADV